MAAPRVRVEASVDAAPFGKYLLLDQLAQGRLASVHRALLRREGQPDERLAIKRFTPELSGDRRFAERAARVLARASQIEHRAHCRIVEVDRADDRLYVALEWIAGRDLRRIAIALRERGVMMPVALVAYIGAQIAEVLAEAHALTRAGKPAPLLHGELSAADILIGYDGRVRLIGLGSAELAVAAQTPTTRTAYQAPEIELGAPCSAQTDVFSLGACMLKVLSQKGSPETQVGARPESHVTQIIPRAFKQIVDRAVAMQPQARWQSAAELAQQLESWIATQTQPADAGAMAAFMRGLFDDPRSEPPAQERTQTSALRPKPLDRQPAPAAARDDEPWAEHTPARGALMQQLASEMSVPGPPPVREAETGKSILDAIMNPADEREPEPPPPSQPPVAPARAEIAMDGWEDAPWEVDSQTVRTPVVSVQRSAPAPLPKPAPVARAIAHVPAPMQAAPMQAARMQSTHAHAAPALLQAWQSEGRSVSWIVIASIAAGVALGLVLFIVWGGETEEPAEPVAKVAIEAASAPSTPSEPVAVAVAAQPSAPELAPQAPAPSEASPEALPTQHDTQASRSTQRAQRKRERSTASAALAEEFEPAPAPPEPEPQVAAPPAPAPAATAAAAPAPPAPAPRPAVAAKPPAPAPSGPTRAAIVRDKIAPAFPVRAKRMDITRGAVTIEYTIDKGGNVKDPRVVSADPKGVFDEAALKAIRQWKYQAALVNGFPAESKARFTFRFE